MVLKFILVSKDTPGSHIKDYAFKAYLSGYCLCNIAIANHINYDAKNNIWIWHCAPIYAESLLKKSLSKYDFTICLVKNV